VAQVSSPVEDR